MNKLSIAAAAVSTLIAWYAVSGPGAPKTALEFNRPALPPAASVDLNPGLSSAFVALPVELGPLAQQLEQALPEQLVAVHEWIADAACDKRRTSYDCNSAKLQGTITRNGPVDMQMSPTSIRFVVPVKYDLTATGVGWAAYLTEHKSGEARPTVSFVITVSPSGGLDVTQRDETAATDAPLTLLKGNVKLARLMDARLKPALKAVEDDLRRTLGALPIRAATVRAWGVMSAPLELGAGSGMWLKASPEYYSNGGFVTDKGRMFYRIAIASKIAIAEADKTLRATVKRQPSTSSEAPPTASRVRMAVPIDLESLRQVTTAAFKPGQVLESRADRFSEPLKIKVKGTKIYPALRQIGLELDIEATTHKGAVFAGKLNLAGRPVLDPASGTVTLADVTFPPVSNKDASGKAVAAAPVDMPHLGTEPFASVFATVAKIDVSRGLTDAVPRAAQLMSQRLGEDLTLTARLAQAVPVSLETATDGAWLLIDLVGDVTFVYENAAESAAAARLSASGASPTSGTAAKSDTPPSSPAPLRRRVRKH